MLIVALDGGGIFGYMSAELLDKIYKLLPPNRAYAGTSTGGIIALCLATGKMTPADLMTLYKTEGKKIFKTDLFAGYGAKYSSKSLQGVLEEHLGTLKLGDLPSFVVIPTVELGVKKLGTWDTPTVLTNAPGAPDWMLELPCVDAAMATSAAPSYFPPHYIGNKPFADGGLFANNPSMNAVCTLGVENHILSIGTGAAGYAVDPGWWMGILGWLRPLIKFWIDGTQENTDDLCRLLLKQRYCRINPETSPDWSMDDLDLFDAMDTVANNSESLQQLEDAIAFLMRMS